MFPKVSIIILNWNGKKDTIECLESLKNITYPNYEILLVDNGSTDGSVEYFKETYPKIKLIENEENLGFAEGNNIAIQYILNSIDSEYILLLNNDTTVRQNFLEELVNTVEKDKNIGICGPKMLFWDFKGRKDVIWYAGGKADLSRGKFYHHNIGEVDSFNEKEPKEVDFISGCCMLIKRDVFEKIGLLDPIYFAYCEDIDFCLRAKKSNFKIIYVPTSIIWHKVSASTKGQFNSKKAYLKYRNTLFLIRKHGKLRIVNSINILTDTFIYSFEVFKHSKKDFLPVILKIGKAFFDGLKYGVKR